MIDRAPNTRSIFIETDRLEEERVSGSEARAALRNLVLMISSLCACGFSELRPTRANTELFQLQGFVLPQPSTPGQAVRNVQAFQVNMNRSHQASHQ